MCSRRLAGSGIKAARAMAQVAYHGWNQWLPINSIMRGMPDKSKS